MQKISGKEITEKVINGLKSKSAPRKILAAILIGGNPASISFLRQKEKAAKDLGVDFQLYEFPENIPQNTLSAEIKKIADLNPVGGVIVQLPLPKQINSRKILNIIPPEKDVDVLSEKSFENFRNGINPVLPPPVEVVKEMLTAYNLNLTTLKIALIGFGNLIGKPIAVWLEKNNANFEILRRNNFSSSSIELKNADVIITATGQAGLIKPEMLKENALVIDFGYNFANGKISGDFNPAIHNSQSAIRYTPTPGGTGPILVAKIMENFYKLNQ